MESLINRQEDLCSRIHKAYSNFRKSPKERITGPYVKIRLQNLDTMWEQLSEGHLKLYEDSEPEKLKSYQYIKKEMYDTTEELYIQYKTELEITMEEFEVERTNCMTVNNKQCQVKLPKIVIPIFSGNYSEWVTFRDLYSSLVHNNVNLDNVQKMQYLKGYLSGEAEQLLRQIPVSDANYQRCWDLLNSRYNNKRYISHFILKRLLSQRSLNYESSVGIKELIDNTTDCLKALLNLGIDVSTWDIIIIHIITLKLDSETRKQWEFNVTSYNSSEELPTFTQFTEFLTNRYRALEFIDTKTSGFKGSQGLQYKNTKVNSLHVTDIQCPFCSESHRLNTCRQFIKKDCHERRQFILEKDICFNCLGRNHSAKVCNSKVKCKICKRRHHTLLHPQSSSSLKDDTTDANRDRPTSSSIPDSNAEEAGKPLVTCFSTGTANNTVLLATALVRAESKTGSYQMVRALVDQGSQISLVTEATVQYLGLRKISSTHVIKGVGGDKESRSVVMMNIKSRICPDFNIQVMAYVLRSITNLLPGKRVANVELIGLSEANLADPQYHLPNKINVLLGADVYRQIIEDGLKKNLDGTVIAQCSKFGWILSGLVDTAVGVSSNYVVMHTHIDDNDELKKFWEMESEPNNQKKIFTEEEKQCEHLFASTTRRDKHGRYIVQLPFRDPNSTKSFGGFEDIVERRLNSLHHKLKKNVDLKEKYKEVINEYLKLGHMEKVPENEKHKVNSIYLPHHAVIRNDKDTTKVRVVFDASCKGKNGYSLNDKLMTGPRLQPELRHLLMRWRKHRIGIAADIVKMYRQILVAETDTDFQRIMWKEEPGAKVDVYRMLRVTFGVSSAPYLAVKALQQVAYDDGKNYPVAAEKVLTDVYMDDLLTGSSTAEEGFTIYREMNLLLNRAGFKLQKWMCNSQDFLNKIKEDNKDQGQTREGLQIKENEIVKILGLTWNQRDDEFQYAVSVSQELGPVTKRKIISCIAKLYDPLGWVIKAKILIQKLWIAGLEWDEEVSDKILNEWDTYLNELPLLSQVKVPRWLGTNPDDSSVELHGFSDALNIAYAAVIYVRVKNIVGNVTVKLVAAKTNVAPITQISIPRLELCGAALLTKLLVEVATTMGKNIKNVRAWTDSTVVLAWLHSHPIRWKTFVANRVSEILTTLDSTQWSHASTSQNPADFGSRGLNPSELVKCHFLVGEPLITVPDNDFEASPMTNLRRWQLTQKMMQLFWRRWSHEYLTKFLHRYKWSTRNPEPRIGDVVVIKEDDLPPCKWMLARIVEMHPGPDNICRVVTVRTSNSLVKRPISKICVLPVAQ